MPSTPTVEELLARHDDVRHVERTRRPGAERFAGLQRRVQEGLEWGVGAVVSDGQRVLLVREDGRWSVPGGGVEPGEGLREAVRREVREETGVRVTVDGLRAVTEQRVVNGGEEVRLRFATYAATPETTALSAEPGLVDEGIEAVDWKAELPENTLDRDLVAAVR